MMHYLKIRSILGYIVRRLRRIAKYRFVLKALVIKIIKGPTELSCRAAEINESLKKAYVKRKNKCASS